MSGTTTVTVGVVDTSSVTVRVEVRPAASTGEWTTACPSSTSPYSCSWATTVFSDGTYDLRAVAVDAYANTGNVLMGVGGGLAATGVVLFIIDAVTD